MRNTFLSLVASEHDLRGSKGSGGFADESIRPGGLVFAVTIGFRAEGLGFLLWPKDIANFDRHTTPNIE